MLQPILLVLPAAVAWVLIYKLRPGRSASNKTLINSIKYTAAIIFYIFQIDAIKAAFLLFRYLVFCALVIEYSCTNYDSAEFPLLYMTEDTQVKCWTDRHLSWALGLGLPALLFCMLIAYQLSLMYIGLVLPNAFYLFILVKKRENNVAKESTHNVCFIIDRHHQRYSYW